MSRAGKNRFVFCHRLDDRDRQLFFAIEKNDESLVLIIKAEDNLGLPKNIKQSFEPQTVFRELVTSRISIHNSDRSSSILSKITNEFSDKSKDEKTCLFSDGKSKLFHPVFFKIYPNLIHEKYNTKNNYNKIIIGNSSKFDLATVCTSVFICGKNEEIPNFEWQSLSIYDFKRYRLVIYHCLLNLSSNNFGVNLFFSTEKGGVGDGGIKYINNDELEKMLLNNLEVMAAVNIERRAAVSAADMAKNLRSHPIYFHPTAISLNFGRIERSERIL